MKLKWKGFAAAALIAALGAGPAMAGNVAVVTIGVPASSDVVVTVPVNNDVQAELAVEPAGISGSTIDVGVDVSAYSGGSFYVRVMTGDGAGLWTTITSASGTVLTVEDADVLNFVADGDELRVYKHQTIGSVFKPELEGVMFANGVQVLPFSNVGQVGLNQIAPPGITFFNGTWLGGNGSATVLAPETRLIIRNNAFPAKALTYAVAGDAPDHPVAFLVRGGVSDDALIGTGYPVSIDVSDTGLGFQGRQLLGVDNTATGLNKLNSLSATFFSGSWLSPFEITPGNSVILRTNSFFEAGDSVVKVTTPY